MSSSVRPPRSRLPCAVPGAASEVRLDSVGWQKSGKIRCVWERSGEIWWIRVSTVQLEVNWYGIGALWRGNGDVFQLFVPSRSMLLCCYRGSVVVLSKWLWFCFVTSFSLFVFFLQLNVYLQNYRCTISRLQR